MTENLFLTGNFAPVADEHTALDLRVTGTIPEELEGRLLRIGPNPIAPDADWGGDDLASVVGLPNSTEWLDPPAASGRLADDHAPAESQRVPS